MVIKSLFSLLLEYYIKYKLIISPISMVRVVGHPPQFPGIIAYIFSPIFCIKDNGFLSQGLTLYGASKITLQFVLMAC